MKGIYLYSFCLCILNIGGVILNEEVTLEYIESDVSTIQDSSVPEGSFVSFGPYAFWCVGDIELCPDEFSLEFWVKLEDAAVDTSDLVILSNGGHLPYSSGIYMKQRMGDQYELGISLQESVWKVKFRLESGFWIHILASHSLHGGLIVYIDNTVQAQENADVRHFETDIYDPVPDLRIGLDEYGDPLLSETKFQVKNLKFYNKLVALSDISIDDALYHVGCYQTVPTDVEDSMDLQDEQAMVVHTCLSYCANKGYGVATIFEKKRCICASQVIVDNLHVCQKELEIWEVYVISSLKTADNFSIDVTCNMIGQMSYTLPGETVIIKITPNFPEIFPYVVDFGDGKIVTIRESSISHSWTLPAEHVIEVSVTIGLVVVTGQTTCKIEYHDEGFAPEKVFLSTVHQSDSFLGELEFIGADQFSSSCSVDYGNGGSMENVKSQNQYLLREYIEHEYGLCGEYDLFGKCENEYGSVENVTKFIAQKFETDYHYITEGGYVDMLFAGDEDFVSNTYVTRNDGHELILSAVDNTVSVGFDSLTLFENYVELRSDQCTVLDSRIISTQTTLGAPIISSVSFNGGWTHITNITVTLPRGNNIFLRKNFGFEQREGYMFDQDKMAVDRDDKNDEGKGKTSNKGNEKIKQDDLDTSFLYVYETLTPIAVTFEVFYDSLSYYPLTAELYNDVSESSSNSLVSVEVPILTMSLKTGNIIDKADPVTIEINLNAGSQGPDKVTFEVDHDNGDVTEETYRSPTYQFTPFTHRYMYKMWENYEICVKAYNEISSVRDCVEIQVGQDIEYFEVMTSTNARVETGEYAEIDLVCKEGSDRTFTVDFGDSTVLEVRDLEIEMDIGTDPYEILIESEELEGGESEPIEIYNEELTTASSTSDDVTNDTSNDTTQTTATLVSNQPNGVTLGDVRKKRSADNPSSESTTEAVRQASPAPTMTLDTTTTTTTAPTTTTTTPTTTTTTFTPTTTTTKKPILVASDGNKAGGNPGDTYIKRISERVVRVNHKYYSSGVYKVRAKVQNAFTVFQAELCPDIVVADNDSNADNCSPLSLEFNHESSIYKFHNHDRAAELNLIVTALSDECEITKFEYSWKAVEISIIGEKVLQRPIYNKVCKTIVTNDTLTIPPRYLDFGLFLITTTVSPVSQRLSATTKTFYLRIVPSAPMAKLSGNLHDTFFIYTQAVADFSESRDPDKDEFDREGIEFDLFCLAEIELKHAKQLPLAILKSKSVVLGSSTVFESSSNNAIRFHDYSKASCFDDELKDNVTRELMIRYDGVVYISGDLFSTSVTAFAFWLCGTKNDRTGCTYKDFVVKKDNSSSALDDLDANLNNTSPAQALRILNSVADTVTVSMKEKIVGIVEKIGDRVESMNQVEESTDVVYRVTKVKEDNTEKTRKSACSGLNSMANMVHKYEGEAGRSQTGSILEKSVDILGNSLATREEGLEEAKKRRKKRSTNSASNAEVDHCAGYDHDEPDGELCYWIFDQNPIFRTIMKDLNTDNLDSVIDQNTNRSVLSLSLKDCFHYIRLHEEPDDIEEIINSRCRAERNKRDKVKKETDETVANLGKSAVDKVSSIVLKKSTANETFSYSRGGMGIALQRIDLNNTEEKMNGASFDGAFEGDDSGSNASVGASMLFSNENQYTFGANSDAIKTGVVSVQFVNPETNEVYNVNNTNKPMLLEIPGKPDELGAPKNFTRVEYRVPKPHDPMNFHEPIHVENPNATIHFELYPEDEGEEYEVYIAYGARPNLTFFDYREVIPKKGICEHVADDTLRFAAQHTFFPPMNVTDRAGTYYIGVRGKKGDMDFNAESRRFTYLVLPFVSSCKYWDEEAKMFKAVGTVTECTTKWKTECATTHLTAFGGDFAVPPNSIDFDNVWDKFNNLNENAAVFSTVIILIGIYIITLVWARHMDKKDVLKWGASPFEDNLPTDTYHYQVTVQTGVRKKAGTESNISIVVSGEFSDSGVRRLYDGKRKHFPTGSILNFVMSVEGCLGPLTFIRVWHDNTGKRKRKGVVPGPATSYRLTDGRKSRRRSRMNTCGSLFSPGRQGAISLEFNVSLVVCHSCS
ncbi:hypothetical protein ScPMuIL_003940 [Solemya velum]